jgi:hypothetical protein
MATMADVRPRIINDDRTFYVAMALGCLCVAVLGFLPTYWMPLAAGTLKARPIIHIHGIAFFLWTVFFVVQAWLGASKQMMRHRALGLVGISAATALTIFGIIAGITLMQSARALGMEEAGKAFAIVPLASILFFAVVFAWAVARVRRPEVHKRLMLVAGISVLDAPIARWFMTFLAPADAPAVPSVAVDIGPALVTCIFIAIAVAHDWRRYGRPHQVYVASGVIFLAMKLAQVPFSATQTWHAVAGWMLSLAS